MSLEIKMKENLNRHFYLKFGTPKHYSDTLVILKSCIVSQQTLHVFILSPQRSYHINGATTFFTSQT